MKNNYKEELGNVYGHLTVVAKSSKRTVKREVYWVCLCSCGSIKDFIGSSLRRLGRADHCGCLTSRRMSSSRIKHGLIRTPEHNSWRSLRERCNNPKHPAYLHYGGRGITCSKEWESFEVFLNDVGTKPSPEHSIERIDNNLGYCKSNCRWASPLEQQANRRCTKKVTFEGVTKTLTEWARSVNITPRTLRWRLDAGWCVSRALKETVRLRGLL